MLYVFQCSTRSLVTALTAFRAFQSIVRIVISKKRLAENLFMFPGLNIEAMETWVLSDIPQMLIAYGFC